MACVDNVEYLKENLLSVVWSVKALDCLPWMLRFASQMLLFLKPESSLESTFYELYEGLELISSMFLGVPCNTSYLTKTTNLS